RYYRSGKLFPIGQLKADNVIYLITGRRENFRAIFSEVADGGSSLRGGSVPGCDGASARWACHAV
ncbi:MAG: hypothetical protein WB800_38200, partial [Streptosporangiaceae bacterium]